MGNCQVITLKQFKKRLYSRQGEGGLLEKKHIREQLFIEKLFPGAFLEEPLARLFMDYPNHNNPTRNKIFGGTYRGEGLQMRVSQLFNENPEKWQEFVDRCSQALTAPLCGREGLTAFLLETAKQMPSAGVGQDLCAYTEEACVNAPGKALAILLLFSMLHSNHTGSSGGRGNIKFLPLVIGSIKPLAPCPPAEQDWSYVNCCTPFLKARFQGLMTCSDEEFNKVFQNYANLFSCVASVSKDRGKPCSALAADWMDDLYKNILSVSSPYVLRVEGPAGTHKNALMQLLFLKMVRACIADPAGPQIAPFYVDLNFYEKNGLARSGADAQQQINKLAGCIKEQFQELLESYAAFCRRHTGRRPLLFIDSIRNYNQAVPLDLLLRRCARNLKNLCCVEDVDTILTGASLMRRTEQTRPWAYEVKIRSVDLDDKAQTDRFLEYYGQLYPLAPGVRAKLKKFPFYTIDSYQLHILSKTLESCQQESAGNLFKIYEQFCKEYLEYDTKQMEQAAVEAFDFAYTDSSQFAKDYYTSPFWVLLRKHASFLDFFIARFYMEQLETSAKTGDIDALNMIMPKMVTRFITPQINESMAKEELIVNLATVYYREMKPYAQSETTYWLGRLTHNHQKQRAIALLDAFMQEQEETIKNRKAYPDSYSDAAQKEDLFLLRGIMVSLIYQGRQDVSDRYILSLIENNLAAQINRGFHLEYYGDIPYLPNLESLNYEDDTRVGEKTLKQLFYFCENPHNAAHPAFELSLFSICSLIQARIEVLPPRTNFNLEPYIDRLIKLLQRRRDSRIPKKLAEYYAMILEDCSSARRQPCNGGPMSVRLYQKFNELNGVPRTGWVDHKIPHPESVTEHMYSAWLMALLLLPETSDESPSYDKQEVMRLLLIHDLGERVTGDIPRPQKQTDPDWYAREEDRVMTRFLLKGTYPHVGRMAEEYKRWKEWAEDSSFNAAVAKEIDTLQGAYQLCRYLLDHGENFSEEKIAGWLGECNECNTTMCRTIFRELILENPAFESLRLEDRLFDETAGGFALGT